MLRGLGVGEVARLPRLVEGLLERLVAGRRQARGRGFASGARVDLERAVDHVPELEVAGRLRDGDAVHLLERVLERALAVRAQLGVAERLRQRRQLEQRLAGRGVARQHVQRQRIEAVEACLFGGAGGRLGDLDELVA